MPQTRPPFRSTGASPRRSAVIARSLLDWYRRNRRSLPWRDSTDPYRIWVSEVMLQQTTVRAVEPKYRRFVRRFPTLASLARAPIDRVLAAWSGLGYYRRARHLHAAARLVMKRHSGRFPDELEAAMALPGVGRYTAGAILSIAYGLRHPVVDGNVARVLSRLHRLRGPRGQPPPASRIWAIAGSLIERCDRPGDLNQALMELGATVCVPRAPRCAACPIRRPCGARAAGLQESIPPPRRRPAPRALRVEVAIVARAGRFLLRRRRGTTVMDGLWELPSLQDRGGLRFHAGAPVAEIRHTIMDRRYTVVARHARLAAPAPRGRCRWVARRDLGRIPTSSLVGKVLAAVSSRAVSSRPMSSRAAPSFDRTRTLC